MRRGIHIALALGLVGCTFEVDYRGKRITCTGAADCPQGTCSRSLGRCVPVGLESDPPVLTVVSPLTPTLGKVGTRFSLALSSSEPLDRLPTVRAGFDRGGQIEFETAEPLDAQQWTFQWQAPAETPSGLARLQISAVDLAGNEVTLPEQPTFSIDVDPPKPSIAGVVLFPPPNSPRPRVDALSPEGLAVIAFSFDEPIDAGVELRASPDVLVCHPISVPTGQVAFNCTLDGGAGLESLISMTVRAADTVGNEGSSELTLVPPLRVDSVPPQFNLDAGLTLSRNPVGLPPSTRSVTNVIGAPGLVEPNVLVQAFQATLEIGRDFSSDAGGLAIDMGPTDRRFATIRACDSAGNLSATIPVKDIEFRSAPGPQASVTAVVMGAGSPRHDRPELVPLAGSLVVRPDDAGVLVTGQSTWLRRGVLWVPASNAVDPSLAFDEGTATVVAQGSTSVLSYSGRDFFRTFLLPTPRGSAGMAYDRRRGVIVIWGGTGAPPGTVLEAAGQAQKSVLTASFPPLRTRHVLVWDGQAVQLLGGDGPPGVVWKWDGQRWESEAAPGMPMGPTVAAYDSHRDEVLALASTNGASPETWRYRAGRWGPLDLDAGPASSIGTMVYDSDGDRFLLNSVRVDGGDVFAFERDEWRWVTPGLTQLRGPHTSVWNAASNEWLGLAGPTRNDLYSWTEDAGFVLKKRFTGEFIPNAPIDFGAFLIGPSLYVYGGTASTATTDFVYRFDGDVWTTLARGPVAKRGHKMVYLPGPNEAVIAGGLRDLPAVNDTSAWRVQLLPDRTWPADGGGWTEIVDAGPLPRAFGTFVERSSREALFFGGAPGFSDTQPWVYSSGTFTSSPTPLLGSRHRLAASFEPGVGVVVSGGSPSGATAPSVDAPLWLVSPSTVWRLDAGLPSPRALHSSIFDPSRREHLIYGGIGSATVGENALGDVVRVRFLDGGHEVSVYEVDDPEGDGHPSARYSHFAGWDDARAKMVVFGGRNLARVENDIWEYSTEPHRPAMVISLSEKDIEVAGIQSFQLEVTVVAGADGELNGMPVEGVTLEIFGGGRWRRIGSMPGSVRAPQRFVFTFSTSAPRLYWGNLERLSLRLISSGRNGRSFARLFVDSVEVALRFTRP